MNESLPRISDAEWEVMLLLWERAPRFASEVAAELGPTHDWSERTVKTLLARLVKKGALKATPDGKRYLYEPAISQNACVRRETRSFLDRVFGGSASPLLAHFVREGELGPGELEQLRALLDDAGGAPGAPDADAPAEDEPEAPTDQTEAGR